MIHTKYTGKSWKFLVESGWGKPPFLAVAKIRTVFAVYLMLQSTKPERWQLLQSKYFKIGMWFCTKSYLGYSDDIECSLIFGCGATTPFILSMADFSESSLAPCWTSLLTGDDTVSPGAALSINWSDATEYYIHDWILST